MVATLISLQRSSLGGDGACLTCLLSIVRHSCTGSFWGASEDLRCI